MKISNFSIFFINLCLLVVIVITCTTIKINKDHEEKMLYAMESKVEYAAKRCYLEEKCKNEITLGDLYTMKYLSEVINPITKEILNYDIAINYKDKKVLIDWKKELEE